MRAGRLRGLVLGLLWPALAAADATPLDIHAVNYPLAYLAERIAGDAARVTLPVPRDVDPAFWRPPVEAIGAFQRADVLVLNGAGYARWTGYATLSRWRSVDTTAGLRDQLIPLDGEATHSHGPEGEHAHGSVAFTTWLDLDLAAEQAGAIASALSRRRPAHAQAFERRLAVVQAELHELDRALRDGLATVSDRRLIGSHPVYQYLARRYGLEIESVHFEPDAEPGEAEWQALDRLLGDHPTRIMIWEAEPLPEVAERLELSGVRSIVYAPCANVPVEGDFLTVMRANVERLLEVLAQPASASRAEVTMGRLQNGPRE